MTLPKDPIKREAYLQRQREAGKARMSHPGVRENLSQKAKDRLSDPEKKAFVDEKRREALLKPEVRERLSKAQRKRFAEASPEKLQEERDARVAGLSTPEAKKKMSASQKKRFSDPEERRRISEATKEAMSDFELRSRISQSSKEYWSNPDARKKQSDHRKKLYQETNLAEMTSQTTREAMKDFEYSPELLELRRKNMQARWDDPDKRETMWEAIKKGNATEEARARWEVSMKILRATPEYREAVAAGHAASKKYSKTDIEVIVDTLLQMLGIEYESQKHMGYYIVDFYIPEKRLIIECDGDYWHSKPEVQSRDKAKNTYLTNRGYKMLRLLGSQILSGDLKCIEDAILGKGG